MISEGSTVPLPLIPSLLNPERFTSSYFEVSRFWFANCVTAKKPGADLELCYEKTNAQINQNQGMLEHEGHFSSA